jgi:hypothetical protein
VQSPKDNTKHQQRDCRAECEHDIGDREKDNAESQDTIAAKTIGEYSGWIGRESVCDIHHHHHSGYERDRQTDILRTQHQECLAKPSER